MELERMLGYPLGSLAGKHCSVLVPPAWRDAPDHPFASAEFLDGAAVGPASEPALEAHPKRAKLMRGGRARHVVTTCLARDGSEVLVAVSMRRMPDEGRVVAVVEDLRAWVGEITVDAGHREVTAANAAACEIFGYPRLVGVPLAALVPAAGLEAKHRCVVRAKRRDGSVFAASCVALAGGRKLQVTPLEDVEASLTWEDGVDVVTQASATALVLFGEPSPLGRPLKLVLPGLLSPGFDLDAVDALHGDGSPFQVAVRLKRGPGARVAARVMPGPAAPWERLKPVHAKEGEVVDLAGLAVAGYVLSDHLGSGAYAEVWGGKQQQDPSRRAAVKVIDKKSGVDGFHPEEMQFRTFEETLENEVRVMEHLRGCPGVAQLLATEESSDNFFLVVEELGETLAHNMLFCDPASEGLPEAATRVVLADVAHALHQMHLRGVAHRDIKPSNILSVPGTEHYKLVDFGVSCFFKPGQRFKDYVGTAAYAAPEMFSETPYEPALADVWSFGVLAYIVFSGNMWGQAIDMVQDGYMEENLEKFPKDLKELVLATLKIKPKERPSMAEIVKAWFK